MDNMFGPLGDLFDLNGDGHLDPIEFGVMMSAIESEEDPVGFKDITNLDEEN